MKNVTKFGLTALACLMLAACGSSGGGSNDTEITAKDPKTNKTLSSLDGKTEKSQPEKSEETQLSNTTGNVIVRKLQDEDVKVDYAPQTNGSMAEIEVEGKKIPTVLPNINTSNWATLNEGQFEVCCGKYQYVRFGMMEGGTVNYQGLDSYFFYNGSPTKDMPKGKASYEGDVAISAEHPVFEDDDWKKGKSTFNADFDAKQLTGNFNVEGLAPITVKAKIEGNRFNGTATSPDFSAKNAQLEGKFYGPKAQELGGLFEEKATHSWGGAFGAKQ
ncbi:Slam-dependent surface lipoprotein [Muribacter muris]|uniref:Slam-dependent surface lipoprotein n=1 Tax=Muribacter muris TaxID=67855 RepID=UPI00069F4A9F|nr:Slam-dependent surface lipoprotein [Muribacter muris]